jgi:hypothetical protein
MFHFMFSESNGEISRHLNWICYVFTAAHVMTVYEYLSFFVLYHSQRWEATSGTNANGA